MPKGLGFADPGERVTLNVPNNPNQAKSLGAILGYP